MSEDKKDKNPPAGVEGKVETTKPVSPPPEVKKTAEIRPKSNNKNDRPRRKRGIMRSFFSHIIVAALAVVAVGGYFHWQDILSQAGGRVCAYDVLGKYGTNEPGTEASVASKNTPKAVAPVAAPPKPDVPASSSNEKTSDLKADEKAAAKQEGTAVVTNDSVEKVVTSEATPKPDVPKTAEQPKAAAAAQSDEAAAPKITIIGSSEKNNFESDLADARRAYWADDGSAEKAYLELIAQYPDHADIKGELGDIYVKAGDKEKAATQYLDAGMIWVKSGDKDKAAKLVSLLERLSPGKAISLKDALASAG